MLEKIARFLILASSVFISAKYADNYWIVGPVFGLAVICWDSNNFKNFVAAKHLAFLVASTLIYALVFHISSQNWNRGSDWQDSFFGSLPAAVVIGSVLLPWAHRIFLSARIAIVRKVICLLIGSYYVTASISLANDQWGFGWKINFLFLMIALWQAIYLYTLFAKEPRGR
jgi:hypothetical protein